MNKFMLFMASFLAFNVFACSNSNTENRTNTPITGLETSAPVYTPVPDTYTREIDESGTIESIQYKTQNSSGDSISKTAYVYLPAGYSVNEKYNMLYLMHGAGGNNSTLMGNTERHTSLKYIIDNMIKDRLIEPLIIVVPSFYSSSDFGGMSNLGSLTHLFQNELRNDLIPAVEDKYSTYAESTSIEDLTNSRNHRAFSGFSMGSVTTWYALTENLRYFQYFIPSSADCWAVEQMGGRTKSMETARFIACSIKEQGYSPLDFFVFAITGTRDMAYENMTQQINAMKELSDDFIYDYNPDKGNLFYIEAVDGQHDYDWYYDYLYVALPYIF